MRLVFLDAGQALDTISSRLARRGSKFLMAVAFLRYDGLTRLESGLKQADGKIVVGASSFCITEWEALEKLRRICEANPKLFVRRIYNEKFHPKTFYFENPGQATAIIGSSNLTAGGLARNVEANVLIDGRSTDQFMQKVKSFVNSLYDIAEPLDENFVKDYKDQVKSRRRVERGSRFGIHRTPVSSPSPRTSSSSTRLVEVSHLKTARWWKIAPGPDATDWPNLKSHIDSRGRGFVSMGWSSVGDLTNRLRWPREKFNRKVGEKVRDSDPDYATRQMWQFGREVRVGDMLVAYSEGTIFGIAKVTGAYSYRPDTLSFYSHTRPVQWLALPGDRPPRGMMYRGLAANRTVSPIIDERLKSYLRRLLRQ